MLKHIVMWKLKPKAEGKTKTENAQWLKENLEALMEVVPELYSIKVGINVKVSDSAYDAVLISTFKDQAALEAYKVNPAHQRISTYCKKVRDSRIEVDFFE